MNTIYWEPLLHCWHTGFLLQFFHGSQFGLSGPCWVEWFFHSFRMDLAEESHTLWLREILDFLCWRCVSKKFSFLPKKFRLNYNVNICGLSQVVHITRNYHSLFDIFSLSKSGSWSTRPMNSPRVIPIKLTSKSPNSTNIQLLKMWLQYSHPIQNKLEVN